MARTCVITLQGVGDHQGEEGGFAPVQFFGQGLLAVGREAGKVTAGKLVEFPNALSVGGAVGEEVPRKLPVNKTDDAGLRSGWEIVLRNNQIAECRQRPRLGQGKRPIGRGGCAGCRERGGREKSPAMHRIATKGSNSRANVYRTVTVSFSWSLRPSCPFADRVIVVVFIRLVLKQERSPEDTGASGGSSVTAAGAASP